MASESKGVPITMRWSNTVEILIAAMENGTGVGKASAREEIRRLGRMVDESNEALGVFQEILRAGSIEADDYDRANTAISRLWLATTSGGYAALRPANEKGIQAVELSDDPFREESVVVWRPGPKDPSRGVRSNVRRSVTRQSLHGGFAFGKASGRGGADLAASILNAFVPCIHDGGPGDGHDRLSTTAAALWPIFHRECVEQWSGWGVDLPASSVRRWIRERAEIAIERGADARRLAEVLAEPVPVKRREPVRHAAGV